MRREASLAQKQPLLRHHLLRRNLRVMTLTDDPEHAPITNQMLFQISTILKVPREISIFGPQE